MSSFQRKIPSISAAGVRHENTSSVLSSNVNNNGKITSRPPGSGVLNSRKIPLTTSNNSLADKNVKNANDISSIRSINTTLNASEHSFNGSTSPNSLLHRSSSTTSFLSIGSPTTTNSTITINRSQTNFKMNNSFSRTDSGNKINASSKNNCVGFNNKAYSTKNLNYNMESIPSEPVKSSEEIVARNKILEEENNVLRNIINEESETGKLENYDLRRILMLKCQVFQLEKQINVLAKSLSFRKNSHAEAFNTISYLSDSFRSLSQNSDSKNAYQIDKSEFQRWTELIESTKLKLYKNQDNGEDMESLSEQTLFSSVYSNKKGDSKLGILDICSGNLNHINLKQISFLESNLADLYKNLIRLRESLKTAKNLSPVDAGSEKNGEKVENAKKSKLLPFHVENLNFQLDECINSTTDSCSHLFDLSLIIPSAPWAPLKKSPIEDLTLENLLTKIKSIQIPKTKQQPVESLFKSYFVASNYHNHMKSLECASMNEELKFYRSCYSLQKSYVESVMTLFQTKYEKFINELNESFNQPLTILIDKFWQMKNQSTEDNLKEFLGLFKIYATKFDTILKNFDLLPKNDYILHTFINLLNQLDKEIAKLNKECLNNLEKIKIETINLSDLSIRSENLLSELICVQPQKPNNVASP